MGADPSACCARRSRLLDLLTVGWRSPVPLGRVEKPARPALSWGGMAVSAVLIAFVFAAGFYITNERYIRHGDPTGWQSTARPEPDPLVPDGAWPFYGRTPAGERFSPLDQITPQNVAGLEQAWSFSTGDMPREGENKHGREFSFEATPIKVGDSLYFCTPHREVIALDATTGELRWRCGPSRRRHVEEHLSGLPGRILLRGAREARRAQSASSRQLPEYRAFSNLTPIQMSYVRSSARTAWSTCDRTWGRCRPAFTSSHRPRAGAERPHHAERLGL